jgi:hypothetical protein
MTLNTFVPSHSGNHSWWSMLPECGTLPSDSCIGSPTRTRIERSKTASGQT